MGARFRLLFMNGADHIGAFNPVDRPAAPDNPLLQTESGIHVNLLRSHRVWVATLHLSFTSIHTLKNTYEKYV